MSSRKRRKASKPSGIVASRHGFDAGGILGHGTGDYRINVSEQTALAVDSVFACVRLIADLVADAEVGEYRGAELLTPSRLTLRPMATRTRRTWLWQTAATMALYDGTWVDRDPNGLGMDAEGVPYSLVPVAPPRVSLARPGVLAIDGEEAEPGRLAWVPRTTFPTVSGEAAWALRLAREAIAAAWAADSYRSDFWSHGGAPVTVLTTAQDVPPAKADAIADRWAEKRRTSPGKPAVLTNGATAELFGADVSAGGSADAMERVGTSVARYFGVPAWLVNVPSAAGSMTYSNAAAAGIDLVRYTLRPGYAGPIGDFLSDQLPGNYLTGRRVILDLTHLTHGTMLERAQAYALATGGRPWMLPSDVRTELHMPMDMTLDEAGAPAPALERIEA